MSLSREDAKMCVGPGWASLIDLLYDRIQVSDTHMLQYPMCCPLFVYVSSVKEKWGTLRIYVFDADDSLIDFIDDIEHRSSKICETCGNPGTSVAIHGWFLTLCSDCQKKRKRIKYDSIGF